MKAIGGRRMIYALALAGLALAWALPAPAGAAQTAARISGFPSVQQWWNLDCEYAAAAAVTLYWGTVVSQRVFLREVPASPNPHWGFRGDINGAWGGIYDYGVYAEPLVPVLERHGYHAEVFYGGVNRLQAEIRAGNPVVVWITSGSRPRPVYTRSYAASTFKLVPGEHAVVVYGFDGYGVYMMDVGDGGYYHTSWASFLRRWGYFDEMSLVITPAN